MCRLKTATKKLLGIFLPIYKDFDLYSTLLQYTEDLENMGIKSSKISHLTKGLRILMVGLDASGKSTILYNLKLGEVIRTIPTVGFNSETVKHKNVELVVCDVGGQESMRPLWRHYIGDSKGLIYVVDSDDKERIAEARDLLHALLKEEALRDAALLVFANKNDFPNAMSVAETSEKLELHRLPRHHWHVESSCATSGEGLYKGLDWLCKMICR
ncbi:hypothetical protein SUGI_0573910 [Cryptomeria japonica]|nr:hypothetical protein SUGI_0573910 [Cryptomeria japonica]